jgi:hypothetical protein
MNDASTSHHRSDVIRYALWLLVAQTAFANRQHYRMMTTWLPHLLTNSVSLLLPDILRVMFPDRQKQGESSNIVEEILTTSVRDNEAYAFYVAPLALGYIVSHPKFNIYKDNMGQMRLGGLGLDSIPHAATAFALSALTLDTLDNSGSWSKYDDPLSHLLQKSGQHPIEVSLGVLMTVTALWEYSEYRTYQHEMSLRGDRAAINMQWDLDDTKRDIVSNLLGWVAAILWALYTRGRKQPS